MLIVLNESTKHKGGTKAVKMNACNASDGIPPRSYRVVPTEEADFILVQQKRQLRRTRRSNGFGRGVFTPPILLYPQLRKTSSRIRSASSYTWHGRVQVQR